MECVYFYFQVFDFKDKTIRVYDSLVLYTTITDDDMTLLK